MAAFLDTAPRLMTGAEIHARRRSLNITATHLARVAQVALYDLCAYEQGKRPLPPERVQRVSTALEILTQAYAEVAARVGLAALCGASIEGGA